MKKVITFSIMVLLHAFMFFCSVSVSAQNDTLPLFLKDRGPGIPTSMFGTYIKKGEFIVYPFYEYYRDRNFEYKPAELGYEGEQDYRSRYTANEGLLFFGYGLTDRLAIEVEAAIISATLHKAKDDQSSMPAMLKESGLGDVEGQLRWRWSQETIRRPEIFSYFETVLPLQKDKKLIGTQDWQFKLGSGIIKGYHWGTMTLRAAIEYDAGEKSFGTGEYAIEYLKRVSKLFRFALVIEGSEDEVDFITDLQFHVNRNFFIRINNGFGITSKATDYAPEIGVVFHF